MTPFQREGVLHLAELSALSLDEAEVGALGADLARIVEYVAELDSVPTAEVRPMASPHGDSSGRLRPDEVLPGLSREDALSGAPRTAQDGFAVPGFME